MAFGIVWAVAGQDVSGGCPLAKGDGPPFIKINRSVRYRVTDLRQWIEAHRVNSTSEAV